MGGTTSSPVHVPVTNVVGGATNGRNYTRLGDDDDEEGPEDEAIFIGEAA